MLSLLFLQSFSPLLDACRLHVLGTAVTAVRPASPGLLVCATAGYHHLSVLRNSWLFCYRASYHGFCVPFVSRYVVDKHTHILLHNNARSVRKATETAPKFV